MHSYPPSLCGPSILIRCNEKVERGMKEGLKTPRAGRTRGRSWYCKQGGHQSRGSGVTCNLGNQAGLARRLVHPARLIGAPHAALENLSFVCKTFKNCSPYHEVFGTYKKTCMMNLRNKVWTYACALTVCLKNENMIGAVEATGTSPPWSMSGWPLAWMLVSHLITF